MTHLAMGRASGERRIANPVRALRNIWAIWLRRRREAEAAAELMTFSDRALADLGIGRCEIERKVRFPANDQVQASD